MTNANPAPPRRTQPRADSLTALRGRIDGQCRICQFGVYSADSRWRCHRYPPVRIPKGGLIALLGFLGTAGVNWEFPTVQSDWVCGEFTARSWPITRSGGPQ